MAGKQVMGGSELDPLAWLVPGVNITWPWTSWITACRLDTDKAALSCVSYWACVSPIYPRQVSSRGPTHPGTTARPLKPSVVHFSPSALHSV